MVGDSMNTAIVLGVVLIAAGIVLFAVSQIFLRRWIKKYNREWNEGVENNDLS